MKGAMVGLMAAVLVVGGWGWGGGGWGGGGGKPPWGGPQSNNWHAYMASYRKPVQYRVVAEVGKPGTPPYGYELMCTFEKPAAQATVWIMVDSVAGEEKKAAGRGVVRVAFSSAADPLDELLKYGPGGDFEVEGETVYVSTPPAQQADAQGAAIVPRPWPVLVTRYVGVGAEASRFIVQTRVGGDPERERVICCKPDGGPIVVGIALESEPYYGSAVVRINAGEYVEFKKGQKLVKGAWAEGDEVGNVVKSVLEHAGSVGVP
jgi:hypothetical protein